MLNHFRCQHFHSLCPNL